MTNDKERKTLRITYKFQFADNTVKTFEIILDALTLELIADRQTAPPYWTKLSFHPCENCPLPPKTEYCPIAVNLAQLIDEFRDSISYERTTVTVEVPERIYVKETMIQKALSSILGIYMPTSNCPIMDKLRPMVRFHLPFQSSAESLYRTISSYLTAQFFIARDGKEPDWKLRQLVDIYREISYVNKGMWQRVSAASEKDANTNAVVILHSIGDSVPYFIEHGLDEIEYLFAVFTGKSYTKTDEELQ
jgi:hypothetical protein